jgi:hypothetical protein
VMEPAQNGLSQPATSEKHNAFAGPAHDRFAQAESAAASNAEMSSSV